MNTSIKKLNILSPKIKLFLLIGILAFISSMLFILIGLRGQSVGFPLDDAWIHQTYAKNLALYGSWSFIPGQISGGSTSPLWTLLITIGYIFSGNFPLYFSLLLSILSFTFLVVLASILVNSLSKASLKSTFVLSLILITEWHLLWATGSGMETILYCLGIVFLFFLVSRDQRKWGLIGLINGLLVWLRPDGITLLGPILLIMIFDLAKNREKVKQFIPYFLFLILLICLYVSFNLFTTETVLPNTFYAKQLEYQELWAVPLWQRLLNEFKPLIIGSGIFLLPGFFIAFYESIKSKNWSVFSFILWIIGFGSLYAIRLPVTYQHGRYIFPILPLFVIFGIVGSLSIIAKIKQVKFRNLSTVGWTGAVLITSLGFLVLGLISYRTDIKVINSLMVEPAKWIKANTQIADIIAVHDIGAMGYFSDRKIIDLAGLVNPDVVPIIRNEPKLFEFMKSHNAAYFVGLSDWYKNTYQWGVQMTKFDIQVEGKNVETVVLKIQ